MSVWLMALLLFGTLFILLAAGLPVAFSMGGVAVLATIFLWGSHGLLNIALKAFGETQNFIMIAVPLFVLMANVLERSGIAERLYQTAYLWMGRLRGGLAAGTVTICTIFAAMSGISVTGVVTMGLVALPSMLKRRYDKQMVMGSIMAGGSLGILIPPSIPMIIYGMLVQTSVGRLFAAGMIPGLILTFIFISYILVRCYFRPELGPPVPPEERVNLGMKFQSLWATILPICLVVFVLGSIYSGIATPSEAAAVGAFGSLICAAIFHKLNWSVIKDVAYRTLAVTGMIMWLVIGVKCFTAVFIAIGGPELITDIIHSLPVNRWAIIIIMQVIWLIMGCFMDPMGITFLTIPIFVPIIKTLGFDPVWFGVLYVINCEMGEITPPYGLNLFWLKAIVPPDITLGDIYRSVAPFVVIQLLILIACMIFPQIVLWLPDMLFEITS